MSKTDWTDPGDEWKREEESSDIREAKLKYARQASQKLKGWNYVSRAIQLRILQIGGHMTQLEAQEAIQNMEWEITPEMLRAGLEAYDRWYASPEGVTGPLDGMVISIFSAMSKKREQPR